LNAGAVRRVASSEERYALAAQGANDGLWDWDLVDNVVYYSPRWKSMLGYQEVEIGNGPEEWLDRIHVADRERVKDEIAAHQRGLTPHLETQKPRAAQGRHLSLDAVPGPGGSRHCGKGHAHGRVADRHHGRKSSRCAYGLAEASVLLKKNPQW